MGWLDGSVALVTGGGSGLGRALVHRFVEEGARLVVLDKVAERGKELEREFPSCVVGITGNVASLADNRRAVALALEKFGRLDTFIGNAGIWDGNLAATALPDEKADAAFDEVFAVNVKGYIYGAKAAAHELARSGGSIIFTVSTAGFYTAGGGILYTAAKHAVVGLVRQLAYEMAPRVRVNGVAPGYIPSDIRGPTSLDLNTPMTAGTSDFVKSVLPLELVPNANDYAATYVLLASKRDSRTTTGAVFNVDAGVGIRGLNTLNAGLDF